MVCLCLNVQDRHGVRLAGRGRRRLLSSYARSRGVPRTITSPLPSAFAVSSATVLTSEGEDAGSLMVAFLATLELRLTRHEPLTRFDRRPSDRLLRHAVLRRPRLEVRYDIDHLLAGVNGLLVPPSASVILSKRV